MSIYVAYILSDISYHGYKLIETTVENCSVTEFDFNTVEPYALTW